LALGCILEVLLYENTNLCRSHLLFEFVKSHLIWLCSWLGRKLVVIKHIMLNGYLLIFSDLFLSILLVAMFSWMEYKRNTTNNFRVWFCEVIKGRGVNSSPTNQLVQPTLIWLIWLRLKNMVYVVLFEWYNNSLPSCVSSRYGRNAPKHLYSLSPNIIWMPYWVL